MPPKPKRTTQKHDDSDDAGSDHMMADEDQSDDGGEGEERGLAIKKEGHKHVLEELDKIQEKILKAVQVASETINHLSEPESLDEESVQHSYEDYLDLMKEIHEGLASRANWIKNYVPYHRHTGELRQEVKALEVRVEVLRAEVRRLGYEEKQGEGVEERKREGGGQEEEEDAMETTT